LRRGFAGVKGEHRECFFERNISKKGGGKGGKLKA
jgi:hypothetical protein